MQKHAEIIPYSYESRTMKTCWIGLWVALLAGILLAGGPVRAQLLNLDPILTETVRLYGDPVISANPDLLNSTSNDAGPWGSKEFLYSFNNDVGPLGSPDVLTSVSNDYGTGLRVRFSEETLDQVVGLREAVKIYGEPVISSNPDLLNSTSNDYGPWGAKESLYSFTNDYGPIGSPDSLYGVSNEYGTGIKVQLADPVLDLDAP